MDRTQFSQIFKDAEAYAKSLQANTLPFDAAKYGEAVYAYMSVKLYDLSKQTGKYVQFGSTTGRWHGRSVQPQELPLPGYLDLIANGVSYNDMHAKGYTGVSEVAARKIVEIFKFHGNTLYTEQYPNKSGVLIVMRAKTLGKIHDFANLWVYPNGQLTFKYVDEPNCEAMKPEEKEQIREILTQEGFIKPVLPKAGKPVPTQKAGIPLHKLHLDPDHCDELIKRFFNGAKLIERRAVDSKEGKGSVLVYSDRQKRVWFFDNGSILFTGSRPEGYPELKGNKNIFQIVQFLIEKGYAAF